MLPRGALPVPPTGRRRCPITPRRDHHNHPVPRPHHLGPPEEPQSRASGCQAGPQPPRLLPLAHPSRRTRPKGRRGHARPQGAGSRIGVGRQRPSSQAAAGPAMPLLDGSNEPGRPAGASAAGAAPYPGAAAGEAWPGDRCAPPRRAAHSNKQDGGHGPSCRPKQPFKSQDVYC